MTKPNFRNYPGWIGMHARDEAIGVLRNGTRIIKTVFEVGDTHPTDTTGTVLGSAVMPCPERPDSALFYFVEWDALPHVATGVASFQIASIGS